MVFHNRMITQYDKTQSTQRSQMVSSGIESESPQ